MNEYEIEINRTYFKSATVTVQADNESEAKNKAFDVIGDALADTSLVVLDEDEVVSVECLDGEV